LKADTQPVTDAYPNLKCCTNLERRRNSDLNVVASICGVC
jgi:hypothetical protein